MNASESPSELIDKAGGTAKVAALCDVSMAAVSQWRESGIPKARLMFLRLARPDVFTDEADVPPPSEPQPQ
jgi:hypothetical protein